MALDGSRQPKPRAELVRPEITRLPELTWLRRRQRHIIKWLARLLVSLFTRPQVTGLEHIPHDKPFLVISNHLGDADFVLGLAFSPVDCDLFAKAELYDFPILGSILEAYGVIWIHRGQPDRRALRAALDALRQGRPMAIAPEGRESLTGSLEEATNGAAYLAIKAGVPLLPVAFTGTGNKQVFWNIRHIRRTQVTMTVGELFWLEEQPDFHIELTQVTQKIMGRLADLLPPEYRGVYSSSG